MLEVSIGDFAKSFGTTIDDFSKEYLKTIHEFDFRYETLDKETRDNIILTVLQRIQNDKQIIGVEERQTEWESGWAENLDNFISSGGNLEALVPKFIRENQPIRYNGDYIMPSNPKFEYDYMTIFRIWLFQKYLTTFKSVYEFGCGTGLNLVLLATLFPDKEFHGLDFVLSAVNLVNKIGESRTWKIRGHLFDMTNPNETFKINDNSAVFTFGAIEQLAGKFKKFILYLLQNKPGLCIHVEPTVELYDENRLFDYLAINFHRKRGYTEGLLPYLQSLDKQGKIKLLKVKRLNFGSLFMEGYTYFVWQPL
jgi:SAM-dependent methyltransferase